MGSNIATLIAINVIVGGWKFWKWLKQRRNEDLGVVQVTEVNGVKSVNRRLHARDWELSELVVLGD